MDNARDPFGVLVVAEGVDSQAQSGNGRLVSALSGAATARLHGFDFDDRPLLGGLPDLPGEVVPAQTAISLLRSQIGSPLVVVFERGDPRRPIVVGVLQTPAAAPAHATPSRVLTAHVDDERLVLSAEREIVLRCGDASITLTRAGKVVIKGTYIVSRSSGYNKIKGAAVDIN